MAAIAHGGHVVKSDRAVFQQLTLNKLWLPDDMINEIKDYLYINRLEAVLKYYRYQLNKSIRSFIVGFNSDQPSLTFYANASKIHGGCHKKYCD